MTIDFVGAARDAVAQMRTADSHSIFIDGLRDFMAALGAAIETPQTVPAEKLVAMQALGDEAVELIEARINGDRHSQKFAGSIYEIRRRLELVERWVQYYKAERRA